MKKISWTLLLVCAFTALGALIFGCNQLTNIPPGLQNPADDQQDDDDDQKSPPGITGFPINFFSGSTLLLKSDGTVWATGNNRYGQFGNGTTISTSPYTTSTFTQVADHVVAIGDTYNTTDSFIIKDDGSLWAAGRNYTGTHTTATNTFEKEFDSGVKAVSVNYGVYLLKEDGSLWVRGINPTATTGSNLKGQLGLGHTNDVTEWTKVMDSGVAAIAKSQWFGLVLKDDGTVWGTGHNAYGALGQGGPSGLEYTYQTTFTQLLDNAKAIAVGDDHSLILKNDGTVWAAGSSTSGKLGNEKTSSTTAHDQQTFQQIDGIDDATAISAGTNHSLILKSDGSVWASGSNGFGQFGKEKGYPSSSSTFIQIVDGGVTRISAQGHHTFIVKNDGTLWVTGQVETGILSYASKQAVYGFTQITLPE